MEKQKKGFKMPHTYVILILVVLIMAIGTYVIPAGQYERVQDPNTGRMVVNPDNFQRVEQNPTKFFDLFKAIPQGMNGAADVIFFIFCTGGAFEIMLATGAIDRGIGALAKKSAGKEMVLIPICLFIFSLGGATFGMSEESIVFVPIGIALARAVGYDALVGMCMISLGCAVGFNSAWMNPFTVGVAQGIAELPTFSGIEMRLVIHAVFFVATAAWLMMYAKKVKKDPSKSVIADLEKKAKEEGAQLDLDNLEAMTGRDKLVLLIFVGGMGLLMYGVFKYGWYFEEISALFVGIGIACGFVGGKGPSEIASDFVRGAKGIAFGALVVGVARAILVIMENGVIIDSIVHGLAGVISAFPKSICAVGMFLVQALINFFIPSGSGQAAATMPIMVPLADVLGLTRQTAVMCFQFGDGFTNSIIPTSSTLMANLGTANITYDKYVKFILPLMGIWFALGIVFVVVATMIGYGPF